MEGLHFARMAGLHVVTLWLRLFSIPKAFSKCGGPYVPCFALVCSDGMLRHRLEAMNSVPLPCEGVIVCVAFLTFCENRSTQSQAKMQRCNRIQYGGGNEVEMATIWPFLIMKHQ